MYKGKKLHFLAQHKYHSHWLPNFHVKEQRSEGWGCLATFTCVLKERQPRNKKVNNEEKSVEEKQSIKEDKTKEKI